MSETLLQTKLFVPPLRPNLVPRPHLVERLNPGLQQGNKLSPISAPAGFGKTTLVTEWLTKREIADRLYRSLNTFKIHIRNNHGKRSVNNRTQAVNRARVLGVLSSS